MRTVQLFNDNWLYTADKVSLKVSDDFFEPITLPHTNKVFDHNNIDNRDYQFVSTYRKRFDLPQKTNRQWIYLDFDGVMLASQVYLNDTLVREHLGGFAPFSVNITDYLREGENTLTVYVDSTERRDIPPYGLRVDYLTFGGIYRDVYLRVVNPYHIHNIFVRPQNVLQQPRLDCDIRLNDFRPGLTLKARLKDKHGTGVATAQAQVEENTTTLSFPQLPPIELWSLVQPTLARVKLHLKPASGCWQLFVNWGIGPTNTPSD